MNRLLVLFAAFCLGGCNCSFTPVEDCGGVVCDGGSGLPPDAGVPDAGAALDAGAAVDAGLPDAGPVDAGIVAREIFDPNEVYLAGTVSEPYCSGDAIAHWSTPNNASTGFDCDCMQSSGVIRPSDGRLLYRRYSDDVLREYHCDACAYSGTYPTAPLANDTVVPTPCPPPNTMGQFLVAPDGQVLHVCNDLSGVLRDSTGAPVYDGSTGGAEALGANGWILTSSHVVQPSSGTAHAISGCRWHSVKSASLAVTDVRSPSSS